MASSKKTKVAIGWREWVTLPALGVDAIKAKVDTGARSSSIHASHVEIVGAAHEQIVRFCIHPNQDRSEPVVHCTAPLHEMRWIKSSNGKREHRPVIRTQISMLGAGWDIDLTLTSRSLMGFRMLLGREAIRGRFLVDSAASYLLLKHPKKEKKPSKNSAKEQR